jgi:hypothetical protein
MAFPKRIRSQQSFAVVKMQLMMKIASGLALLALLLVAACSAGNGNGSQNDKNGGFYGGISGGGQR